MILLWDNLGTQILAFFALWLIPPLIMIIAGIAQPDEKRETAIMLYSVAVVYFLAGIGMCLSMA